MKRCIPALALLVLASSTVAEASAPRHFEDASLRAVQFVGDTEAWAVGDEGVIWHTIDTGKNWERVPSGTRGSLRSLCFVTPHFGWIVGREELPKGSSAGIVLYTTDGGVKWHRVLTNALPGLNRVRFVDEKVGFLMGDGTDTNPSGLLRTTDGGRTWKAVDGPRVTSWFDGDFVDGDVGALGGAWSRLAKLRGGQLTAADVDTLGARTVRGVRIMEERSVAVGDGGLILVSKTKGGSWGYADVKLPMEVLANLDFHSLDCLGSHVWVVGRPGTVIFHSSDSGLNWEQHKTNQSLPLHGIYFRDEQYGLAVGALGTVLVTSDGGKNWKVQRQGGQRAAALFVHADGAATPLQAVAHLGLEECYLTTGLRVVTADPKTAALARAADEHRYAAAFRLAGGAAAETLWQFPLPKHLHSSSKQLLIEHWDGAHGKQAAKEVLRQLVLALRTWRPEVVVTDHPDAAGDGQAAALVAEALTEAVKLAADPQAFPEQIQHLHLQPWQVAKVYTLWDEKKGAHASIDGNDIKECLQASLRDFCFPAASLLTLTPRLAAQQYFRLGAGPAAEAGAQGHLMAGVEAKAAQGARRKVAPIPKMDADLLAALKASHQLQVLAENPVNGLAKPDQMLAQLKPVLSKLPMEQGATAAFALANHYVRVGQWSLAQEIFLTMTDQFPAHPLTANAYRWLILHSTSSEVRRRVEMGQFVKSSFTEVSAPQVPTPATALELLEKQKAKKAAADKEAAKGKPGEPKALPDSVTGIDWKPHYKGSELSKVAQVTYLSNPAELTRWYKLGQEFSKKLEQFGPLHADDPAVQFSLNAAHRNVGDFKTALDWCKKQMQTATPGSPWQLAAAAEYWLAYRKGPPPKPVLECRPAPSRPFLDGEFDDPCWQSMKPVLLEDAAHKTAKDCRTEVRLSYDQDFLYVALSCTHAPEHHAAPVKARQRDEDLRAHDRVSILLDLDRDYATYFHLQVDQRGCVCEDCWGDRSWNPKWFVAVRSTKTCWNIEAAIPLAELTGRPIPVGTAWACNVVRVLPGRGVQALAQPADVEPVPEGMGLLLFQSFEVPHKVQPVSHTMPTVP